ncbi:hypothetical protein D2E25_0241 [Bifidobacterium goeldii]|uniref:Uncharacterized protein n=1 Tax=Bifidobacterium goeldii TaxID=2306975 RepID=A0A430FLY8_9BIFI|nr:hypothetical protein [Bifidobacterium goeldii]RSX53935.1 hypothetical protein D2E25_0241 [Bifidobacterium goeldii]
MRVTLTPRTQPSNALILVDAATKNINPLNPQPDVEAVLDVNSLSDGWYSSLEPDVDDMPIPAWHGSWQPSFIRLKRRTVTLKGHRRRAPDTHGRDTSTLEDADFKDRLNALAGERVRLEVEDDHGYRWADGYVGASIPYSSDMGFTVFSIVLVLEPFKHGVAAVFPVKGGRVHVENHGSAPSWPIIHAANPNGLSFVNVSDGVHQVSWRGSGKPVSVDLDYARLAPSAGRMNANDTVPVPPGGLDLWVSADAGSTLTVSCAPSWK